MEQLLPIHMFTRGQPTIFPNALRSHVMPATKMDRRIVAIPVALSLALGQWTGVFAQNQAVAHKPFALTIENIMRGPGLYGYEPNAVRWSGDSQRIYFTWKQASDPIDHPVDTYVVNRDGSGLRKLTEEEIRLAPPTTGGGRGGGG